MSGRTAANRRRSAVGGRRLFWALLALITLLGSALRTVQVSESLWLDELHTSWTVSAGPLRVASRAAMGNHSPLYFYLAWASTAALGDTEAALRLPSLIAGIALIPCFCLAVWHWTGSRSAGLLAALLATLDRNCIFYAQEARPYACVQLVGLLHLVLFWRVMRAPRLALRMGLAAGAVLLFYLHYTAVLLLAAEAACGAALSWTKQWRPLYKPRRMLADLAAAAVFALPAVPHLAEIARRRRNWELFVGVWPSEAMLDWALVYFAAPITAVAALAALRRAMRQPPSWAAVDRRVVVLAAGWLAVPLGIAWVATFTNVARLFHIRYVMVAALAPILATALCYVCRASRVERSLIASLVVLAAIWASGMEAQYRFDGRILGDRTEDWRGAVALINGRTDASNLPVLVRSGLIEADALAERQQEEQFRRYCLLPVLGMYRLERPFEDLAPLPTRRAGLDRRVGELVAARGGAWLLIRGDPSTVDIVLDNLLHSLQTAGLAARRVERHEFGDVTAARIRVAAPCARSRSVRGWPAVAQGRHRAAPPGPIEAARFLAGHHRPHC